MRAATIAALFGEGILVTLNATKLIMYWGGVTSIIIAFPTTKVCINMKKFQNIFYAFTLLRIISENVCCRRIST